MARPAGAPRWPTSGCCSSGTAPSARRSRPGCCRSRSRWSGWPGPPATASTPIDELPALLPDADVVVLIVPLTDATRGLVDADFLARMKDGALLVNVARGAVVVTDDLVAALDVRPDPRRHRRHRSGAAARRTARCGTRPTC